MPPRAKLEFVLADSETGAVIANNRPGQYVEAYGADALQYLVTGRAGAVAFVGHHFYVANQEVFWAAPLVRESGEPFVAPSETSIGDRSYPLSRAKEMIRGLSEGPCTVTTIEQDSDQQERKVMVSLWESSLYVS